jgi:hypothetical protein
MATALTNTPPTPTTAMVTEPSSSSVADEQQQQYLSSTSSTVSQSPIQEGTDGGKGISGADHSCSDNDNSDGATTTIILQGQQQRSSNTNSSTVNVMNPYKKQVPNPPSIQDQDPNVQKRKQFIEKYRLKSLHNISNQHRQGGGGGERIASRSALEVLRMNQQWRQQWRRRGSSEYQRQHQSLENSRVTNNDNGRICCSKQFALRPRLFLFQRMMQTQEKDSMTPQQQQEGVWELGTGITEVSGEGGSGKTQICLSLCMTCALTPLLFPENLSSQHPNRQSSNNSSSNDNNYTSIYITMGEGIPQSKVATRLHQMLHHRVPNIHHHQNKNNKQDDDDAVERILSRIWLLSLKNEDDFIEFVEIHLPNILNNQSCCGIKPYQQQQQRTQPNNQYPICNKVGFIAFDGIANFFRFSDPLFQQHHLPSNYYNQKSLFHQHRSSKLFQISSLLRKMSDVYDVPIVMTNQVTSSIPSDDGLLIRQPSSSSTSLSSSSFDTSSMMGGVGQNKIQPALGLIWSNCVTTRFILQRKDRFIPKISTNDDGETASENGNSNANNKDVATTKSTTAMQRVRKASVLQSICTPEESEVWYFIDAGAVVAVPQAPHRLDNR